MLAEQAARRSARAARALALDLLAARAHASEELARKLERRSFTANVVRVVIEELLEDGWLDDAGFAATRIAVGHEVASASTPRVTGAAMEMMTPA